MENKVTNRNLIIAALSLFLTILGMMTLEVLISLAKLKGDTTAANIILELIILIIPCLVVRRYNNNKFNLELIGMKFSRKIIKYTLGGLLTGVVGWVFTYLLLYIMKAYSYLGFGFQFYSFKTVLFLMADGFFRFLFAGTCEEVFFRGVLFNYLARYKGKMAAIMISSIIFAIFHITRYQNFGQLFCVMLMGIIFSCCFIVTKSLYFSIGFHFGVDFFSNLIGIKSQPGFFMIEISKDFGQVFFEQSYICINALVTLVLLSFLFYVVKKKREK